MMAPRFSVFRLCGRLRPAACARLQPAPICFPVFGLVELASAGKRRARHGESRPMQQVRFPVFDLAGKGTRA